MSRPAVFLDRDGTLIQERDHLESLEMLELFPWTADALRLLNRAGFATVVVTNQSGVGRGLFDETFVREVHRTIDARLARGHARIEAYFYCPHHPSEARPPYLQVCGCRKPRPGMIEQACRELDLDPQRSFMIGDRWIDVKCGQAAGVRSILVRTGYGSRAERRPQSGVRADAILNNLMEAVGWILRNSSR